MSESEHSRETRSTRGTKLCAQETVGVRGEAFVLSPRHLSHLHRQPTPLSRMGSLAVCSALRPPRQQRLGYFSRFLPLPLANARHLRHSLSAFKIYPPIIKQVSRTAHPSSAPDGLASACRTPQRRFLYGTVSRVPRVQKDAGFLYRMYPQAVRVQERTLFCTGRRIAPRL